MTKCPTELTEVFFAFRHAVSCVSSLVTRYSLLFFSPGENFGSPRSTICAGPG